MCVVNAPTGARSRRRVARAFAEPVPRSRLQAPRHSSSAAIGVLRGWFHGRHVQDVDPEPILGQGVGAARSRQRRTALELGETDVNVTSRYDDLVRVANEHAAPVTQTQPHGFKRLRFQKLAKVFSDHTVILAGCAIADQSRG